ncbi:hypothetical protein Tco_0326683 [Tanacetum coccineum]
MDFPSMTKISYEKHNFFISKKCIKVLTLYSRADLEDVSEDFQIEFKSLPFIHLESVESVMLVNRIPKLMHVDFWNISSDEKCRVVWSESKSIQNNLKRGFSLNLSRIESSVAFQNVKSFLLWNKFQIKFGLLSSNGRHDSARICHI